METKEILKVQNLSVGYGKSVVLEDLDFWVKRGEITVILGSSGCGKSTILKTIVGLIPSLDGEIFFQGERVDYTSEHGLQDFYGKIGVLYQNGALLNSLSLYDNIALPIKMQHPDLPEEIEREMVFSRLVQVGLAQNSEKFPAELSGGMRKRAALARSMVLDPDIIFCDEPSAGLDPITATGLDDLMLNLKELFGITLVVVTHELRSIERIADKAIVLRNGGMHFWGAYRDLLAAEDSFIRTFFLRDKQNGD